jgi:hypothetical protein
MYRDVLPQIAVATQDSNASPAPFWRATVPQPNLWKHDRSVRMFSQVGEMLGHGLDVPHLVGLPSESVTPLPAQTRRDRPAEDRAPQTHAYQVPLGCPFVDEAVAAVQHRQVVDEMNVTSLSGELKLSGPGNSLYGVEGFNLLAAQRRQARLARVGS